MRAKKRAISRMYKKKSREKLKNKYRCEGCPFSALKAHFKESFITLHRNGYFSKNFARYFSNIF